MPITGMETELASALASAIQAAIQNQYGKPLNTPNYIPALSTGIANALIPFLVTNTEVNPLGPGTYENPAGAVTGVSSPGTIS